MTSLFLYVNTFLSVEAFYVQVSGYLAVYSFVSRLNDNYPLFVTSIALNCDIKAFYDRRSIFTNLSLSTDLLSPFSEYPPIIGCTVLCSKRKPSSWHSHVEEHVTEFSSKISMILKVLQILSITYKRTELILFACMALLYAVAGNDGLFVFSLMYG